MNTKINREGCEEQPSVFGIRNRKTKLFGLPKFGSLRGSTSASLRLAKFWQSAENWQVFGTGGRTYFALLADRFITYKNKIGSSATRAIVKKATCLITILSRIQITVSHLSLNEHRSKREIVWRKSLTKRPRLKKDL